MAGTLDSRQPECGGSEVRILFLIGLMILIGLFIVRRLAVAEPEPHTALQVFSARRTWKTFPTEFLEALANNLQSVEKAKEFVALCESTSILDNNIAKFARGDDPFALGMAATTLTSYANAMGQQEKFHEAKRALEFAILLRPRHIWAWASMALVTVNLNDCRTAVEWADKVLNFKPDLNSDDPLAASDAAMMTPEGEQTAAAGLQDPGIVGSFAEIIEGMKEIKESRRGKA